MCLRTLQFFWGFGVLVLFFVHIVFFQISNITSDKPFDFLTCANHHIRTAFMIYNYLYFWASRFFVNSNFETSVVRRPTNSALLFFVDIFLFSPFSLEIILLLLFEDARDFWNPQIHALKYFTIYEFSASRILPLKDDYECIDYEILPFGTSFSNNVFDDRRFAVWTLFSFLYSAHFLLSETSNW